MNLKVFLKWLFVLNLAILASYLLIKNIVNVDFSYESYFKIENLIVILIVPVIEEFVYRWGLVFSPKSFAFMLVSIPVIHLTSIIGLFYNTMEVIWLISIISIVLVSVFVYFFLSRRIKDNISFYSQFHKKNFSIIFWLSLILFVLSHYSNYEQYSFFIKLYFLISIFFSGWVFSKVRISKGIWFSILLHITFIFTSGFIISKI